MDVKLISYPIETKGTEGIWKQSDKEGCKDL